MALNFVKPCSPKQLKHLPAMSFSFSFSGDDIEDDHVGHDYDSPTIDGLVTNLSSTNFASQTTTLIPPKRHTFAELLASLPSQLSYNLLEVVSIQDHGHASQKLQIPRRALFDIRQQLMHEVDPTTRDDSTSSLLAGLETGDLSTGIYEGGFKTWECAVDLASLLLSQPDDLDGPPLHVIELGAGSAIPSLVLLKRVLQSGSEKGRKVRFTLCDYNEDVLRLCTAVNTFMTVALHGHESEVEDEGELDIEEESVPRVLQVLKDHGVEIEFVSGAWGDKFVGLLHLQTNDQIFVLASETIYSPASLEIFARTVLNIVRSTAASRVLVAAKKVYFGVGGGVQEFVDVVQRYGGSVTPVLDVPGAGVGRVVLEVSTRHN